MKTLHRFILKSFAGPFFITFCISLFVLLMHFVWLYIDDLVGKGLGVKIIAQLLFYTSITLVPMALPLSILLSSLMTFGNMGEHYELVAFKSAGISLQRIMLPLMMLSVFFCFIAFFFSNTILPYSNLKMKSLLYDVRESKPFLKIKEGIFYRDIDNYSIRIGKKDKNTGDIGDVMIYDHPPGSGNNKVILAKRGVMQMSADRMKLLITLYDGYSYEEVLNNPGQEKTRPLIRGKFEKELIQLDLSDFHLSRTDEELFKGHYEMMNVKQLGSGLDSIRKRMESRKEDLVKINTNYDSLTFLGNTLTADSVKADTQSTASLAAIPKPDRIKVIQTAASITDTRKRNTESIKNELRTEQNSVRRFQIELHKKYTLSIACLILFFIGAPLGAIIRKGGLGMPVVVSVLFFIFFHILSISGEKAAREGALEPYAGMWMATSVLLPVGAFLTYKATRDSSVLNAQSYRDFFKKSFRFVYRPRFSS